MSALADSSVQNQEPENSDTISRPANQSAEWQQFESLFVKDFYDLNFGELSTDRIVPHALDYDVDENLDEPLLSCLSAKSPCSPDSQAKEHAIEVLPEQYAQPNTVKEEEYGSKDDEAYDPEEKVSSLDELDSCPEVDNNKKEAQYSSGSEVSKIKLKGLSAQKRSRKKVPKAYSGSSSSSKKKKKSAKKCVGTVITETIFNGSIADIVKTRKRGAQCSSVLIDSDPLPNPRTPPSPNEQIRIVDNESLAALHNQSVCYSGIKTKQFSDDSESVPVERKLTLKCEDSSVSAEPVLNCFDSPYGNIGISASQKTKSRSVQSQVKKHKKQNVKRDLPVVKNEEIEQGSAYEGVASQGKGSDFLAHKSLSGIVKAKQGTVECTEAHNSSFSSLSIKSELTEVYDSSVDVKPGSVDLSDVKNASPCPMQEKNTGPVKRKLKGIEEYKAHKAKFRKENGVSHQPLSACNSASSSPRHALLSDLHMHVKSEGASPMWTNLTANDAQPSLVTFDHKGPVPRLSAFMGAKIKPDPDLQLSDENVYTDKGLVAGKMSEQITSDSRLTQSENLLSESSDSLPKFILTRCSEKQNKLPTTSLCDSEFGTSVISDLCNVYFDKEAENPDPLSSLSPYTPSYSPESCASDAFNSSRPILETEHGHAEKTSHLDSDSHTENSVMINGSTVSDCQLGRPAENLAAASTSGSAVGSLQCTSSQSLQHVTPAVPEDQTNQTTCFATKTEREKSPSPAHSNREKYDDSTRNRSRGRSLSSSSSGRFDYVYRRRHMYGSRSPSHSRSAPYGSNRRRRRSRSFSERSRRNRSPLRRSRSRSRSSNSRHRRRTSNSRYRRIRSSSRSSYEHSGSEYNRKYSRESESPGYRGERHHVYHSKCHSYRRKRPSRSSSNSSDYGSDNEHYRYSRSPQRRKSRSYKHSSSSRSPDNFPGHKGRRRSTSRNRSYSPRRNYCDSSRSTCSSKRRSWWEEQQRQIDERRVVYVGLIPDGYTKTDLRSRFCSFGGIEDVRIHIRRTRRNDNYGFVTFHDKQDAYRAVECGNDPPFEPKFDISFGGRRRFCKYRYSDLDKENEVNERYYTPLQEGEDNFDALLKAEQQRIKIQKKKY